MSTEKKPAETLKLRELAEVLVRHFGHHEGFFEVTIDLQIAVGAVNMAKDSEPLPGAVFSIAGLGLLKSSEMKSQTVDAAKVNPAPPSKTPKKKNLA